MGYSSEQLAKMTVPALEAELEHHNHLYWDANAPEISDYDYDRLVEALRKKAPDSAVLVSMGPSLEGRYGAAVTHSVPMLSLDKCYTDEDLLSWTKKFHGDVVVTPKMDGIAASLRYDSDGRLTLAATRGSGLEGDDITANVHTIDDVPKKTAPDIEVRGEIYMRLSVFRGHGDQFSNPRNLAAGAIKSKDPKRCRQYKLSFAAYDVLHSDHETEQDKFDYLVSIGFPPVSYELLPKDNAAAGYAHYAATRDQLDFEIDGVVFKANQVSEQRRLGATAHHPRFAMAYKFQGDSGTTTLDSIEWSVARSGAITPVALIEPVELSGAMVGRASLHHAGFIEKLGLTLGAEVVVTRRGGVIPNVECVSKPGQQEVSLPEKCPSCGGEVVTKGDFLHCARPHTCRDAVIGTIAYFCKVLDIQGFGDKLLSEAYDRGVLTSPVELFTISKQQLLSLDRVGDKLATKLLTQVEEHRELGLAPFLRALGIEELGKHVSRILEDRYETLERIRTVTAAELAAIHSIGEIIAEKVVRGLHGQGALIDALLGQVRLREGTAAPKTAPGGVLAGKSFVFTGKLLTYDRKTAQKLAQEAGAETPSGVTKSLSHLVVGDGKEGKKSSKQVKAEKLVAQGANLEIISESVFVEMLGKKSAREGES